MKIKRSVLATALKTVAPAVANKEQIAQSASFIFTDGRVFTYNDEIAVSTPVEVNFTGAVPAKEFLALVNKVKSEELELTISKGELLLKGSKAKAGLRLEAEIKLPLEELGMPDKWIDLPDKFNKAVQFCLFSASRDDNKAILMNIHVKGQYVESCDNYRVTQYDMGKESAKAFPKELLIPATSAREIIVNNPTEYARTTGWFHFKNEADVTFSCRTFEAEYPDFSMFLDCDGEDVEFPALLPDVLDRAGVMGDGERVTIILEKDEITITTENESGWFEETIDAKYKGKNAEFDIQPEFMKSIMKFNGTAIISDKVLRFDNDNFIHVVQLMVPRSNK